jgi:hypothetical protein
MTTTSDRAELMGWRCRRRFKAPATLETEQRASGFGAIC